MRWLCGSLLPFVAWWLYRTLDSLRAPPVWVAILSRPDATARRKEIRRMWQAMTCGSAKFVLCQQGRGTVLVDTLTKGILLCWIMGSSMSRWIPTGSTNIKCDFSCSPCQAQILSHCHPTAECHRTDLKSTRIPAQRQNVTTPVIRLIFWWYNYPYCEVIFRIYHGCTTTSNYTQEPWKMLLVPRWHSGRNLKKSLTTISVCDDLTCIATRSFSERQKLEFAKTYLFGVFLVK